MSDNNIDWEEMEKQLNEYAELDELDRQDEEELAEIYKEIAAEEKKRKDILKENIEIFKQNIDYDYEHVEEYLGYDDSDLDYHEHIGYVSVEKTDYINGFEQNKPYYVITGDDNDKCHYGMQDESDEHTFHVLVFQTSGYCEDDYSGYLLFPMKDGRYWKVRFWS